MIHLESSIYKMELEDKLYFGTFGIHFDFEKICFHTCVGTGISNCVANNEFISNHNAQQLPNKFHVKIVLFIGSFNINMFFLLLIMNTIFTWNLFCKRVSGIPHKLITHYAYSIIRAHLCLIAESIYFSKSISTKCCSRNFPLESIGT